MTDTPSIFDAIQYVALIFVAVLVVLGAAGWLWDKATARYLKRRTRTRWAARVVPIESRKKPDHKLPRGAA